MVGEVCESIKKVNHRALQVDVLPFRYVDPFRNMARQGRLRFKIEPNFALFDSCKYNVERP